MSAHPTPPPPGEVLVDDQNPWPGLVSFTEEASTFFRGRSEENAELFRLVTREPLSVVFGQSGLGKTSLLQAGLFPELRRADFLPVYVRLNHAEESPPLASQVLAALREAAARAGAAAPEPAAGESLWEYFQRRNGTLTGSAGRPVTPVLVLDQFEEIFTQGRRYPERVRALTEELECLVENRAPARVRARLEAAPELMEGFDFDRRAFRLVLSLREDFLPELENFRNRLRGLAQNRFRLQRMNGRQALVVALEAGSGLIEEAAARRVVENLGSETAGGDAELVRRAVEPALLSVVLRELNFRRRREGARSITPEMVTVAQDILHDFYEDKIADLPVAIRAALEDAVLSDSGRYRVQAALDDLAVAGVASDMLDRLVDRRILRYDERYGARVVELTHDRLVPVVQAGRMRREQERKLLEAEKAAREAEQRAQEKLQQAAQLHQQAETRWREYRETGLSQKDDWRFTQLSEIEGMLLEALGNNPEAREPAALLAAVRRLFVETAINTKDLNLATIYLQKLKTLTAGGLAPAGRDLGAELEAAWAAVDPARSTHMQRLRRWAFNGCWVSLIWTVIVLALCLMNNKENAMTLYFSMASLVVATSQGFAAVYAVLAAAGEQAAVERTFWAAAVTFVASLFAFNPVAFVTAVVMWRAVAKIRMSKLYWPKPVK